MQKNQMADEEENQYGVLLYYKYASIPDIEELYNFYDSNCTSLSLLGRVRVASHGVNVTVGGKLSALKEHIDAVKSNSLFEGTDFKLASCNHPTSDRVAKECGFTSLSIRIVKELVTLSSHPLLKPPEISNAGKHLSAVEFHSVINNAGKVLETESMNELVLLDARNLYETRIGKFQSPKVKTLDPEIRQYSDLPTWIESNSEHLRGKHILMYCTGGIRCEMASAYIKSKGGGFENVYQLYGGIQRYLEQFPEGGFFKGKNFVFDHRVAVGSSDSKIIGNCLLCGCEFDDYSSRSRCAYCRMLVLVCDNCQKKSAVYMCELCKKFGKIDRPCESIENSKLSTAISIPLESHSMSDHTSLANQCPLGHGLGPSRKLRILCLHGFRQNASSFKGRTASLAKKLKAIAELRFVDAPHELPFIYQLPSRHSSDPSFPLPNPLPPTDNCKKKFAWLVAPDFSKTTESDWKQADGPFDPLQYEQQTEGFDTSVAYIENIISQAGPFDGILGFSQGAAMAALLCAHGLQEGSTNFRFAILCSGFAVNLSDCERNSINCPSLHIFGSDQGQDRQVTSQTSRALASFFENGCSVVIEHDSGHIIPTRPPYIDQVKDFLRQFL